MRYKSGYHPSFLLCPEAYTWHPIAECKTRLDQNKYCRFNDDPTAQDKDGEIALNEVRVTLYFNFRLVERQARDLEIQGLDPGPGWNFSLEI